MATMSDPVGTATWPGALESILDASAVGPERVAQSVLAAASAMLGADWAALVRWGPDGAHLLAGTGQAVQLPAVRLPDGPATVAGHPAGTVAMGPSTDLVV